MNERTTVLRIALVAIFTLLGFGEAAAQQSAADGTQLKSRDYPIPRTDGIGRTSRGLKRHISPSNREMGAVQPYSNAWADKRRYIVAPWTHVLDKKIAEAAIVHDDRLVFPAKFEPTLEPFERLDIVISPSRNQSFMRRILDMRRVDDRIVVQTRNARLTEAILKGHIQSPAGNAKGRPGPSGQPAANSKQAEPHPPYREAADEYRKTRQPLGGDLRNPDSIDYTGIGHFDVDDLGLPNVSLRGPYSTYNGWGHAISFRISGTVNASIRPRYWFNLDIDFDNGDREPKNHFFFSTRKCESGTECFHGGEAGGEFCLKYDPKQYDVHRPLRNLLESGQRYCAYYPGPEGTEVDVRVDDGSTVRREEYQSCDRILSTLEYVKEGGDGERCGAAWEEWYESKGKEGARNPKVCQGWTWDAFAPYPAQLEWAKTVCGGSLDTLELDFRADLSAGIDNFELGVLDSGFKAWDMIDPKTKVLATPFFWIGPVPVLFTVNFQFHIPFFFYASAGFHLNKGNPSYVGTEGLEDVGSGIHVYGSAEAYRNGHFGPRQYPGYDYLGRIHPNENVQTTGEPITKPELGGNFSGGGALMIMPELNTRLYDMVGPFVRPLSQVTSIKGAYGTETTCNLAMTAGFRTDVGLQAQLPFGIATNQLSNAKSSSKLQKLLRGSPQYIYQVYNTCSDSSPFVSFDFNTPSRNRADQEGGFTGPKDPICRDRPFCFETCFAGHCPESSGGKGDQLGGSGEKTSNTPSKQAACSTTAPFPTAPPLFVLFLTLPLLRRRR